MSDLTDLVPEALDIVTEWVSEQSGVSMPLEVIGALLALTDAVRRAANLPWSEMKEVYAVSSEVAMFMDRSGLTEIMAAALGITEAVDVSDTGLKTRRADRC